MDDISKVIDELTSGEIQLSASATAYLRQHADAVAEALRRRPATGSSVQGIINPAVDVAAREHLLHRVGMGRSSLVTILAVHPPASVGGELAETVERFAESAVHAEVNGLGMVIAKGLTDVARLGVPVGARVAFAGPRPAIEAPEGWHLARLALRFSKPSPRDHSPYLLEEAVLVDAAELGGYALLADTLTARQIDRVPDVHRLGELVQEFGSDMLVCLEAVAATDSLRKAAARLHLHHNSVAHRVERAEAKLGYSFTEPYGRTRLFLALVLRRLRETEHLMQDQRDSRPFGSAIAPDGR